MQFLYKIYEIICEKIIVILIFMFTAKISDKEYLMW